MRAHVNEAEGRVATNQAHVPITSETVVRAEFEEMVIESESQVILTSDIFLKMKGIKENLWGLIKLEICGNTYFNWKKCHYFQFPQTFNQIAQFLVTPKGRRMKIPHYYEEFICIYSSNLLL